VCVELINLKTFSEIILEKLFLRCEKIIEKLLWWVKLIFSQCGSENNYFRKITYFSENNIIFNYSVYQIDFELYKYNAKLTDN
jgi:hypothetical protein